MTYVMWHVTTDMWHVKGGEYFLKILALELLRCGSEGVLKILRFWDFEEKDEWIN